MTTVAVAETDGVALSQAPTEKDVIRKIFWRVLPYIVVLYMLNFIDRVNVSFAALTMSKDLGFSATVYGFGAGIFFLGFFLCEIPSNLMLERYGARRWIARIQLSWGLAAMAMAFTAGETSFYWLRFLLGVAEGGFFPGMILYMTYWFPSAYRARVIGAYLVAIPIASVIGSPISSALLSMDGIWGWKGWQWLFILEGLPTVLLAFVTWKIMPDKPESCNFLLPQEKNVIVPMLQREEAERKAVRHFSLWEALLNWRVLTLTVIYFCITIGLYGITFWLPQIIRTFGFSNFAIGFVTAAPFLFATVAMLTWVRLSDRSGERVFNAAAACVLVSISLAASTTFTNPLYAMICMAFAITGTLVAMSMLWTMSTTFLTGTAAAGAFASISAFANLSGFVGPFAIGWLKDLTGSFGGALVGLASFGIIAAVIIVSLPRDKLFAQSLRRRP